MYNILKIVIVNWNSGNQLRNCLKSVEKAKKDNFYLDKIILVDNASTDNSLDGIENIDLPIEIIKNRKNYGFGKACNIGAKNSTSDFILFLNPDTMVYKDTFKKLFDYIKLNDTSDTAIYGVQLVGDNGEVQRTCARFPKLTNFLVKILGLNKINKSFFKSFTMEYWDHKETKTVDQVIGAFFMIKKDVFEKLNGFDERFFVYYEELDLSKRIYDNGYKTVYLSSVQAYHKGGGTSEQVKALRFFYSTRSSLIYSFKHLGIFKSIILMFFVYLVEPFTRTAFLLLKRSSLNEFIQQYKGFGLLYRDTFNIIKLGLKK